MIKNKVKKIFQRNRLKTRLIKYVKKTKFKNANADKIIRKISNVLQLDQHDKQENNLKNLKCIQFL